MIEQHLTNAINEFVAAASDLRLAVAGMTCELLDARPVNGAWSTMEVICHLQDMDSVTAVRIKQILSTENPVLMMPTQQQLCGTLTVSERKVAEELDLIELTRMQLSRILRSLDSQSFTRSGTVLGRSDNGTRTLDQLVVGSTKHLYHHLRFIHEKRAAMNLGTEQR